MIRWPNDADQPPNREFEGSISLRLEPIELEVGTE